MRNRELTTIAMATKTDLRPFALSSARQHSKSSRMEPQPQPPLTPPSHMRDEVMDIPAEAWDAALATLEAWDDHEWSDLVLSDGSEDWGQEALLSLPEPTTVDNNDKLCIAEPAARVMVPSLASTPPMEPRMTAPVPTPVATVPFNTSKPRKRTSTTVRRRREIDYLRVKASELERELSLLTKRQAMTSRHATASATADPHDRQLWAEIADRQRQLRQQAQDANASLRSQLQRDCAHAHALLKLSRQQSHWIARAHRLMAATKRFAVEKQQDYDMDKQEELELRGLLRQLYQHTARMLSESFDHAGTSEAVPRGVGTATGRPRTSIVRVDIQRVPGSSGGSMIDFRIRWVFPFTVAAVADRMWQFLLQAPRSVKIQQTQQYESNDFVVTALMVSPIPPIGSYQGKRVMGRFMDARHVTIVSNSQMQSMNSSAAGFTPFSIKGQEWLRVKTKTLGSSSPSVASPWRLAQVEWTRRMHVTPLLAPLVTSSPTIQQEHAATFTDVLVREIRKDIHLGQQSIENQLLLSHLTLS